MTPSPPLRTPRKRWVGWLAVLVINLALLAGLELLSYGILRLGFAQDEKAQQRSAVVDNPFSVPLGWVMESNMFIGEDKTLILTDAAGHAVVPDPLPQPRFTVVVLGGSVMFGVGVTNNALTVPAQLQTALRRDHGLQVNVVNLGARGYVSLQEMLILNEYLSQHSADLVLSVSGHNDVTRYLRHEITPSYVMRPEDGPILLVRRVERGELLVANVGATLRTMSRTADLVGHLLQRMNAPRKDQKRSARQQMTPPAQPTATFLQAHLANYAMMQAACEVRHIPFKLYLQPDAFTKARLSDWEQQRILSKVGDGSDAKLAEHARARNGYRAAFVALPKPFPFADLAPVFGNNTNTVFRDGCHLNETGMQLVAQAIAADVAPLLRARAAGATTQP